VEGKINHNDGGFSYKNGGKGNIESIVPIKDASRMIRNKWGTSSHYEDSWNRERFDSGAKVKKKF